MPWGDWGMMNSGFGWGMPGFWMWPIIIPLLAWSLIWKGVALWKAARNGEQAWFIALLVINTVGILEIIYIFFFAKDRKSGE